VDRPAFTRVEIVHPLWSGFLRLSTEDDSAMHETYDVRGTYEQSSWKLTIVWQTWGTDTFFEFAGLYVQEDILRTAPKIDQIFGVAIDDQRFAARKISVVVPGSDYDVNLRLRSSDIPTFGQVFVAREYDTPNLPASADAIVDLGANIGLATVFFGLKYPHARLLSVEPDGGNFAVLVGNVAALGDRARCRRAAVWTRDGQVGLRHENDDGSPLGAWGVQVAERPDGPGSVADCRTLGTLLDEAGFARVDILKIDIEGAEMEIFAGGAQAWLHRIGFIIIETHDRFRPGSEAAVRAALLPGFEELAGSGENLVFRRRPG